MDVNWLNLIENPNTYLVHLEYEMTQGQWYIKAMLKMNDRIDEKVSIVREYTSARVE